MMSDNNEKHNNLNEDEEKKKDIEIVTGDGKDLEISRVYDHIKLEENKNVDKNKEIVIPKEQKQD